MSIVLGVSHWGLFECDGASRTNPQAFADALYAGFITIHSGKFAGRQPK